MSSNNQTRNQSFDIQRGVACLLMIFAHVKVVDPSNYWTSLANFIGGLAPMLFFSVAGATTLLQARKYSTAFIAVSQLALFLFGLAYSMLIYTDQFRQFAMEIFQIIAIGSLLVALLHRFSSSPLLYLLTAVAVLAIKFACDRWAGDFDGAGLLLTRNEYVPHHLVPEGTPKQYPGFPLLPWLFVFCLGAFIGQTSDRIRISIATLSLLLLAVDLQLGVGGYLREKWDMTVNYALLGITVTAAAPVFAARIGDLAPQRLLLYLGRNSLLFFFAHLIGVLIALAVLQFSQLAGWLVAIGVTLIVMRLLDRWRGLRAFDRAITWWCVLAGIWALPLLVLYTPTASGGVRLLELLLGILFAKHYPALRNLLLKRMLPKPQTT